MTYMFILKCALKLVLKNILDFIMLGFSNCNAASMIVRASRPRLDNL